MEFSNLVKERRSVRAYQAETTVGRDTIEELIKCAQLAPTWKNSQTGRYYIVDTPEKTAALKSSCLPPFNQKSSAGAPVLIVTTFVRGVSGFTAGEPDNELGDKWGAYDLGLQNAYLVLKAKDMGLDTLIMGIRDEKKIREQLEVPENEDIAAVIALGYGEGEPIFKERKHLDEIARFI
jgi:nitroreductase